MNPDKEAIISLRINPKHKEILLKHCEKKGCTQQEYLSGVIIPHLMRLNPTERCLQSEKGKGETE